jgi:hypothetical protein
MNGAFAGSVDGGAGTNTLSINGGTQAAPVAFTSVSNIATLTQTGGFATVSGTGTFGNATLTGGRLVGLAGSVLNAASFRGQRRHLRLGRHRERQCHRQRHLSPGASPGTMTVNGNVTLNSGSTSLFEITPTVSDKLIVNGKLTILSGSTLQIAATTPIKVGTTLDLISATGGVNGTYDTVTGIAGTARVLANGDLGLLVQFANPAAIPRRCATPSPMSTCHGRQQRAGRPVPRAERLQDGNGAPIASAFARLTPEPYADAMQIGTETALSLAGNARRWVRATGGRRISSASARRWAACASSPATRSRASAMPPSTALARWAGWRGGRGLCRVGLCRLGRSGSVDRGSGRLDQARGVVGGVAARFGGPTRITLSANYDNAHALTRRVPDAGTISTSYALPSWSFDASISHALPLGGAGCCVRRSAPPG